jgi:hypothetical protein
LRSAFNIKRRLYETRPRPLKGLVSLVPFPIVAGSPIGRSRLAVHSVDRLSRTEVEALQERRSGNPAIRGRARASYKP